MKKTSLCLILLFLGMEMMPVKGAATDRNNYAINSDTSAVRQVLAVDTFSHMNNTRGFLSYNMQELSLRQGPTIGETLGRIPGIQHLSFGPNVGLPVIRSLSGHSGLKHTEKYTRAVDKLKSEAINSLPELKL